MSLLLQLPEWVGNLYAYGVLWTAIDRLRAGEVDVLQIVGKSVAWPWFVYRQVYAHT
jgi:hypothetical protein